MKVWIEGVGALKKRVIGVRGKLQGIPKRAQRLRDFIAPIQSDCERPDAPGSSFFAPNKV